LIAVDTNLLVYAHRSDSPWFDAARKVLRPLVEGTATWAIPWPCVHEFLAVVTHPRIYNPPTPLRVALEQVCGERDRLRRSWLERMLEAVSNGTAQLPRVIFIEPQFLFGDDDHPPMGIHQGQEFLRQVIGKFLQFGRVTGDTT